MTENKYFNIELVVFLVFLNIKVIFEQVNSTDYVQILLVFAYGILIPMVLKITVDQTSRFYLWMKHSHLYAYILATVSFLIQQGILSTILSFPWLGFTALVSIYGFSSMIRNKAWRNMQELLIHGGLIYIIVGGLWLTLHRTGIPVLHFKDIIVLLTSIHFHYAAVVTVVSFGLIGRYIISHKPHLKGIYNTLSFLLLIGPMFIAVGITFSPQLPILEFISVVEFVIPIAILAFLGLVSFVPLMKDKRARTYFSIALISLFVSMTFAFLYGYGHLGNHEGGHQHHFLDIPLMIFVHGVVNAFGFSWFMLKGLSRLENER